MINEFKYQIFRTQVFHSWLTNCTENTNINSSFLGNSEQSQNLLHKSVFYVLPQLLFKVIYDCQHDQIYTR